MISIKANSSALVLLSAVLLIILVVFTKQGNETFKKFTGLFGELSKEILLVVIVLLLVMMIININEIDMNAEPQRKGTETRQIIVEGFDGLNSNDSDGSKSFCEKYQSDLTVLDKQCQKFNKDACNIPSCCVWLNGEKCVSGSISGPTFKSDKDDNDIEIKNYYHQGQCYGNNCS